MGSGSGGILSPQELRDKEERVRRHLRDADGEGTPHVFISFAVEDESEVNLLRGQAKNENSELDFDDYSVKEPFNSKSAEYIKSRIREKIKRVSVTIVYLTESSASSEWVNWEIEESARQGKYIIGVYKSSGMPTRLPKAFEDKGYKIVAWSHEELRRAIDESRVKK